VHRLVGERAVLVQTKDEMLFAIGERDRLFNFNQLLIYELVNE